MWPGRLRIRSKHVFHGWARRPPMKNMFWTYTYPFPGSKRVRRFAFVIFHHSKSTECLDFHLQGQSVSYLYVTGSILDLNRIYWV